MMLCSDLFVVLVTGGKLRQNLQLVYSLQEENIHCLVPAL